MMTLVELQKLYDKSYADLHKRHIGCGIPIISALKSIYPSTQTVVDIGCNNGWLVKDLLETGFDAYGIDVSEAAKENAVCPKDKIVICDIRECAFFPLFPKYDIGFCFEVLEHIEKEKIFHVFQNFRNLVNRVIITASTMMDGEKYHINVKNHSWWMEKFLDNGFVYRHYDTLRFHNHLAQDKFRPITEVRYPQVLQGVMIFDT